MAVMRSKDGNELYVDCHCTCNDGIRIRVEKDEHDFYYYLSYTNGNWYRDQTSVLRTFEKLFRQPWKQRRHTFFTKERVQKHLKNLASKRW